MEEHLPKFVFIRIEPIRFIEIKIETIGAHINWSLSTNNYEIHEVIPGH